MIDFGLLCLFTLQVAMVLLVYHAWRGIKAEISALDVHRQSITAVTTTIAALSSKIDAYATRIADIEASPKAARSKIEDLADALSKYDRRVDAIEGKVASLGGRISAFARHRPKVDDDDDDVAPAPKGEGMQIPMGQMPPGAIRLTDTPPPGAVPPGFGVVNRRRHG